MLLTRNRLFLGTVFAAVMAAVLARGNAAEPPAAEGSASPPASPPAETAGPSRRGGTGSPQRAGAPPTAQAGSPAEQFAARLEEWKGVLKQLRELQAKFSEAQPAEADQIRKQYADTIAQGEQLIPALQAAALAAYAAAPQEDRQLERFLLSMLRDAIASDRYEEAASIAKTMIDAGCEIDDVWDAGGVAAFATNDFATAEADLKKADEEGAISEKGREFRALLPDYKGFWEAEKQLREKESQADDLPRVRLSTTKGDVVVELFENQAPETVGNFVSLVEKGFYNGLTFHRVLAGFMAQGGCPLGDGKGGPGYNIACECYRPDHRKHFRGTLSMAHAGRDTGGSQFFLTFVPTQHLNGRHTAFGRVIEGLDVLAKLQRIDPEAEGSKPDPDKIVKAEVVRKRDHEYKPTKSAVGKGRYSDLGESTRQAMDRVRPLPDATLTPLRARLGTVVPMVHCYVAALRVPSRGACGY